MRRLAVAVVLVTITQSVGAQDTLEPVRQLYASADYEGALSMLGRLGHDSGTSNAIDVDRYRVLCLFALGRHAEAEQAIERILADDPLYAMSSTDVPPRIRAAFGEVRRRVLPAVIRDLYAQGKAAYDRRSFADAVDKLERALKLLDNPDVVSRAELVDLRTLTSGFLELSRSSLTSSPSTQNVQPLASAPASAPASAAALVNLAPAASGDATAAVVRRPDASVAASEPVAVRQPVPPWPGTHGGPLFNGEFAGSVVVDIDERGRVTGAQISDPIHPLYDPVLLKAASNWLYEPARRDGQPIKSSKRVNIVLRPR